MAPLISTGTPGPLGLLHLPRLWQKLLLHAAGLLPEGYRHGAGGFDELLCRSIGLDRDAFVAYVEGERPSYLETEAYVREHATNLNSASVEAFNHTVTVRDLPTEMLAPRCRELGIPVGEITRSIALNNLDDWAAFHRACCKS
jgi:hypothetical protein